MSTTDPDRHFVADDDYDPNADIQALDRADLDESLIQPGTVPELVVERAARAFEGGADGIICSPNEAAPIRALPESEGRLIVTPGVRPAGAELGDQKRVTTPAEAIANGADHVVVGRPIWQAPKPAEAAAQSPVRRAFQRPQLRRYRAQASSAPGASGSTRSRASLSGTFPRPVMARAPRR